MLFEKTRRKLMLKKLTAYVSKSGSARKHISLDYGLFEPRAMLSATLGDSVVTINELSYNPIASDTGGEWIELHNQLSVDVDLTDWKLSGGIEFAFALGTTIGSGEYLVVAKDPTALASATGISGVLGGFTGSLSNGGETIHLLDLNDRIMDELIYDDEGDWPVAADGSGATLAKINQHRATGDFDSWHFSDVVGGTPGSENTIANSRLRLSEIAGAADANFTVELENTGTSALNLSGYSLVVDGVASFSLSGVVAAGGFLALSESVTGLNAVAGDKLFLAGPGNTVVDGAEVELTARARSEQWQGRWQKPNTATDGTVNSFDFEDAIVINEILYHQVALGGEAAETESQQLVAFDSSWRYNQTGVDQGQGWSASAHVVGSNGWQSGNGLLGVESAMLSQPLSTQLNLGPTTYYFETDFDFSGDPTVVEQLIVNHIVDDGAIFYLNGVEVERFNLPDGVVDPTTFASPGVGDATGNSIAIDPSLLVVGSNRLSVEVHQVSVNSSDIVLGAQLIAVELVAPGTPVTEDPEEWIELYNNGGSTVDLSNWKFDSAIEFDFAPGTTLDAGEYLIIANDNAALSAKYPNIAIATGEFDGKLGNSEDLIRLVDAAGNLADEVRYVDGGQFDERADGGGASLELRDPDADNSSGQAWSVSDSGDDAQWQTITYTGATTPHDGTAQIWNEFIFGLLDDGEILIDDISVIFDPGGDNVELIQNGSFDSGLSTWRAGGNHRFASIVADPDDSSNQVLQLIATGPAEHVLNHVETTLVNDTEILIGETYQISYRARWVSGSNQLNTRLYFNQLPHTERLDRPTTTGTPGTSNFSSEFNIGPTYQNLQQSIVAPSSGQSVDISVEVDDPDGVNSVVLWYATNEGAWQQTTTTLGNGLYTGTIPGFSSDTVVQFYLEGIDSIGASSTFPVAGQDSRAIYKVNASAPNTSAASNSLQIVLLPSDSALLFDRTNLFSNDALGATVIDETGKIYYDVGTRFKGSLVGRDGNGGRGFWIGFNPDDQYRGVHDSVTINRNGLKEIYGKHLLQAAGGGVAGFYDDIINLESPTGALSGLGILNLARYGDIYLDAQFEDGSDGNVFNFELLYKPTSTTGGVEDLKITGRPLTTADGQPEFTSYGDDPEVYRYNFQLENNRVEDDFSGLIEFVSTFDLDGQMLYEKAIEVLDLDQFVRTFTATSIVGQNDTYTRQANPGNPTSHNEHNLRLYENPEDGKFLALPWDLDRTFQLAVTDTLWGTFGTLSKLFELPQVSRLFYGHAEDIINNVYTASYVNTWGIHYGDLLNDNGDFDTERNYILNRSAHLLSELPSLANFGITTNGGNSFTVPTNQVVLGGTGSYKVRELQIDGIAEPLEVTWIDDTNWEITVDLVEGANDLTIRAFDFTGTEIHSDSITVTTPNGSTVSTDNLRISEIHFNPGAPSAAEIAAGFDDNDDFEFIEIYNPSSTGAINLNGVQLAAGVTFDFGNVNLQAGERAVVVEDVDAFMTRYGDGVNVLGQWTGALNNGGEEIALLNSDLDEIRSVNYGDNDPWYNAADGNGFSLVLEDPVTTPVDELGKYYSWRASTELGGTPGAAVADRSGVVVNELLANSGGAQLDVIELFNSTSSVINVSGWYLSDSGDDLLKYQIPSGTVIAAGGYLVFDESDFNASGAGFALNSTEGDEVYLSEAVAGIFVGLQDAVEFDATFAGKSIGRLPNGSGRLTRLAAPSFGAANGQAEVGPLVISEINFHPESPSAAALAIDSTLIDNDLEYIEIANPTSTAIDLTNWRIRGEADYDFAAGTSLAAGAAILVVSYDPTDPLNANKLAAFEAHYSLSGNVNIVGGLSESLSNSSGRISLQQPDAPDEFGIIPRVVVDEVVYDDLVPWPDADGSGQSLHRNDLDASGSFSASWTADTPTPGVFVSPFILGDVNQDGVVNFLDISPFISLLQMGNFLAEADIDGNGVVNFLDISPFISLLSSQ